VFANIALPDYGAFGRDGGRRIVNYGQETFEEAPDPDPKTAKNMRSKTGLRDELAPDDREDRFFRVGKSQQYRRTCASGKGTGNIVFFA
jgi:hypothetical protein